MGTIIRKTQRVKKFSVDIVLLFLLSVFLMTMVFGEGKKSEFVGKLYEFGKDEKYEFHKDSDYKKTGENNTYGNFYLVGDIVSVEEKSGIPAYEIGKGNLEFHYNYDDTLLNTNPDEWHLVDDKSKVVADMTLDSNIMKGAIILQTSRDRKNWINVETICNAFSDTPIRTDSIYETSDIQLINGCFYRVLVVYQLSVRTEESSFLFVNTDNYDYKKYAEVYEFYAYTNSEESDVQQSDEIYRLGTRVRAKNFDGYFGEERIDKNDPHYGWNLGSFFVSGYTDEMGNGDGNMVFLKNVGDKVTLWFKLNENINALNGKEILSITSDDEGYDQYFETPRMNFGRGVLIVRQTDHNNVKLDPTIYTNFLEANVLVGADTKVQLFEEGDYEVALDYQVTSDELFDRVGHYRIFFKFSVRNSNCMVYPFDVETGSELTNSAMTKNGFRLDLAKSRYLKINIKREILTESADGLTEDTRFNGSARDGAEYTDEGIYTITVSNQYTGTLTTKKIYVGNNNILRAHMNTGLSIQEINRLLEEGATISENGAIQIATTQSDREISVKDMVSKPSEDRKNGENDNGIGLQVGKLISNEVFLGMFALVVFSSLAIIIIKKKRTVSGRADKGDSEE